MTPDLNHYDTQEEKLNIYSHAFGVLISVIGTFLLLKKGISMQSMVHVFSYAIYGISMITLFSASTLYHAAKSNDKRKQLKIFDHAAIYFLIAGTYTPFTLLLLKGNLGWIIFGIAWFIGICGILLKLFFTGRFKHLSTASYLLMGWIIVFVTKPLINNLPHEGLYWIISGGACYTIGAIIYSIKSIPYNHAIFHFFVLGGCISLYIPILLFS